MKGYTLNTKKTQSGSTDLIIIIVLSLALLGTLGFTFWQNYNRLKTVATNEDTKTSSNQSSADINTTDGATDNTNASILVGNFYSEYMAISNDSSISTSDVMESRKLAIVTKYGTASLVSKYKTESAIDNVTCLQQYLGAQKIVNQKEDNKIITVTVQEDMSLYNNDGSIKVERDPINIPVSVIDQNGLKIDSIDCANTNK